MRKVSRKLRVDNNIIEPSPKNNIFSNYKHLNNILCKNDGMNRLLKLRSKRIRILEDEIRDFRLTINRLQSEIERLNSLYDSSKTKKIFVCLSGWLSTHPMDCPCGYCSETKNLVAELSL